MFLAKKLITSFIVLKTAEMTECIFGQGELISPECVTTAAPPVTEVSSTSSPWHRYISTVLPIYIYIHKKSKSAFKFMQAQGVKKTSEMNVGWGIL
jgi:hypothetical protein